MTYQILTSQAASITELKKHPMQTFKSAHGNPIAILSRNEPIFYCVPAKMYEAMMEIVEDIELAKLVDERLGEEEIEVNLDEL